MKELILLRGEKALVDNEVYDCLMSYGWTWRVEYRKKDNCCYIVHSHGSRRKKEYLSVYLHRWILESFYGVSMGGLEVDHADRNTLNNCLTNLRVVTRSQNACNRGLQSNNKTGFRGVSHVAKKEKFEVVIRVKGKAFYLGCYTSAEDAARAYDAAAKEHFGEFAQFNFPGEV